MNCYLSKAEINSFATNVVCLKLISDSDISHANIKWEADSDILRIRDFCGDGEFDFNDGVLLSLDKVGTAYVTATLDGVKYVCKVNIREPKRARHDEKLNFYIGDFHDHSTWDHTKGGFPRRTKDFPIDIINSVSKEGKLDFVVLSDHGSLMQNTDLFRAFYDEDRADCKNVVVFPGSESECIAMKDNDFGFSHRESGEFVLVNSAEHIFSENFDDVNECLSRNPHAIVSIAHPHVYASKYGGGTLCTPRILKTKEIPEWKNKVKLVEMGNGTDRGTNLILEPVYSYALDHGYKVSPVCTSDCHGKPHEEEWGYGVWPAKTVIMAPEKSKDAFLDALRNNRVYGTENGNTALYFTVNEGRCGDTLLPADTYKFHVEIGDIDKSIPKTTVRCEVVSDYGKKVKVIENVDFSSFDFTVESNSARYFYLRIIDDNGLKTWSAPVFTGRDLDEEIDVDAFEKLDTTGFEVTDSNGKDLSVLLSENPYDMWHFDACTDTVITDMKNVREFSAIRLYEGAYNLFDLREQKIVSKIPSFMAEYPSEYRISISDDGKNYIVVSEGIFRVFGLGNTIYFGKVSARFVKIEILSTVGKNCCYPEYTDAKISLGEIVFLK